MNSEENIPNIVKPASQSENFSHFYTFLTEAYVEMESAKMKCIREHIIRVRGNAPIPELEVPGQLQ